MSDKERDANIFELIGDAAEAIDKIREDNEELINRVSEAVGGEGQTVSLTDQEPLTQLDKTAEEVIITLEVPEGSFPGAKISNDGNVVAIEVNDKVFKAEVPSDVDLDGLSYNCSNGVLEITIPREDDSIGDVEIIESDEEGKMMDEEDD